MKIKCLAIISILCPFIVFSFSPSWHKYYSHINSAEQFICKGIIRAAYQQYKLAFAMNNNNIAITDVYNAFHAAAMVKDTAFAKQQLQILLHRRLSQKFIDKRILGYYTGQQRQYIQQWVDLYKNDTIVLSETALHIQHLIERDQDVLRNATGSKYYGGKRMGFGKRAEFWLS